MSTLLQNFQEPVLPGKALLSLCAQEIKVRLGRFQWSCSLPFRGFSLVKVNHAVHCLFLFSRVYPLLFHAVPGNSTCLEMLENGMVWENASLSAFCFFYIAGIEKSETVVWHSISCWHNGWTDICCVHRAKPESPMLEHDVDSSLVFQQWFCRAYGNSLVYSHSILHVLFSERYP